MLTEQEREYFIHQYIMGHDTLDFDLTIEALNAACKDGELARILEEIDREFQKEAGIEQTSDDLAPYRAKRLIKKIESKINHDFHQS